MDMRGRMLFITVSMCFYLLGSIICHAYEGRDEMTQPWRTLQILQLQEDKLWLGTMTSQCFMPIIKERIDGCILQRVQYNNQRRKGLS